MTEPGWLLPDRQRTANWQALFDTLAGIHGYAAESLGEGRTVRITHRESGTTLRATDEPGTEGALIARIVKEAEGRDITCSRCGGERSPLSVPYCHPCMAAWGRELMASMGGRP